MSVSPKTRGKFICLTGALILMTAILLVFGTDQKTNRANIDFLAAYGWEVKETPEEVSHLILPDTFNMVFETYNAVVKASGFDLLPYRGMRAVRYTYRVYNHQDTEKGAVFTHIFRVKDEIVAADICSFAEEGFLLPISDTSGQIHPLSD